MISKNNKIFLLQLARATLKFHLKQQKVPTGEELGIVIPRELEEKRGVFVTLYERPASIQKVLRGCIGTIFPIHPLYQAVIENTINAAMRDPRFLPVREEELKHLSIEINLLTVPHPVASYEEIRLGEDGIILSQGERSAVFLPSVPLEWNWNLSQTLEHLSFKAGLARDAWSNKETQFQTFQSVSFSE